MPDNNNLSTGLQENLLVLLTFSNNAASLIRDAVEPRLFGSALYRDLATRIYGYLDQYHKPPAEHLPDLFDGELEKETPEARQHVDLIEAVFDQKGKVNEEFVLKQLETFVRRQTLKGSIIAASDALQDNDMERAETVLQEGLTARLQLFNPGLRLSKGISRVYSRQVRPDLVPTGIKELDRAALGPARGEFHLFIGPPKRGKTWWLIHMSKRCLMARLKVTYISLELPEPQIEQRMIQSLFSMTQRDIRLRIPVTRLRKNDLGHLLSIERDIITGRLSVGDPASRPVVEKKMARLHGRNNLMIKQFPAGYLTVRGLDNYLDMLERAEGFVPDMVVIDYPDYMKINPENYRFEIGAIYNDLRGLAVRRNVGVIAAKRSNREGTKARLITEIHAAEDYSAVYTADTVLTYSQTGPEKELGLARLLVSNTRVADKDGFILLLSQAYPIGQFCLESVMMQDNYWGQLEQMGGAPADEEEE